MKRPPFVSQANHMLVIDYLCRCGGKWSEHTHDLQGCEAHGGSLERTNCKRFRFAGYMYEQARIVQEAIRPLAIEETKAHYAV